MNVFISTRNAPRSWEANKSLQKIIKIFQRIKLLPQKRVFLSLSVVDVREMAKLNFKYRGKHEPTDVLSFEQKMKHSPKGIFFLGDLVLCSNVVRRQAKVEGHPVKTEVAVLLVHGILHLLGFDHEHSRKKAAQMAAQESKILKQLYQRSATGLISRAWVKVQK